MKKYHVIHTCDNPGCSGKSDISSVGLNVLDSYPVYWIFVQFLCRGEVITKHCCCEDCAVAFLIERKKGRQKEIEEVKE